MKDAERTVSVGIVALGACAITEPHCPFPAGGSELQLYLLARFLSERPEFRVTLYVADLGQPERATEGIRVLPLVRMKPDLQLPARAGPRIVRRLAQGRHDLLVTRSASAVNGLAWLAARLSGAKHLHMCAHDDECSGLADLTLSRPAKWLHHLGLRHADAVACQTKKQVESLQAAFGLAGELAPNLSPGLYPAAADERREGILWVGRDVEWKAPELFLELARRLPQTPCTMVCQPQQGRDIRRLAAAAPKNVRFLPGLPIRETALLFPRHRVFVLTSLSEGFPNVLLQAARAGTPVVSLRVDPEDLLTSTEAGFACEGEFEEVVRRTAALLASAPLWEKCHEGALRLARENADSDERVLKLIRRLVAPEVARSGAGKE